MKDVSFTTIELSDPRYERSGMRHATVFSSALGRRADCTFWSLRETSSPLHLVVLLHGVYASHWAWTESGGSSTTHARVLLARTRCRASLSRR